MIKTLAPIKTNQLTLLMIQDEPTLSPILRQMFEDEQMLIKTVSSAADALELIETLTPQLILADLDVPGLDSFGLLEQLKLRLPQTPVVFLTAPLAEAEILHGFERGVEDYILKPARPVQILGRIRKLLPRQTIVSEPMDFSAFAGRTSSAAMDLPYPWSLESLNRSARSLFDLQRDSA